MTEEHRNFVEDIARKICEFEHRASYFKRRSWVGASEGTRDLYRKTARELIAYMRERGMTCPRSSAG